MAVIEATRGRLFGLWREFVTDSVADHPADPAAQHPHSTTGILTMAAIGLTGLHFTKTAPPRWWMANVAIGDVELTRLVWWGAMNLGTWWVVYAIQFLSLEFLFRGFMIHGLRPHLGFASIGVMMVPTP